jgi:hypothetical protein
LVSRLNSPNVDIFLLLLLLLPSLASSSRLRRVAANGEKGTRSLARLGSSSTHVKRVFNYRADGGERDQQSARRGREPKRRAENEKLEPLAAARVKKKKKKEEKARDGSKNVIFSKKIPEDPTLYHQSMTPAFILSAAFKNKTWRKCCASKKKIISSRNQNRAGFYPQAFFLLFFLNPLRNLQFPSCIQMYYRSTHLVVK